MANILLVEDDAAAEELIRGYLRMLPESHQMMACSTAASALSLAKTERFDLFLLDIQLPDYRGTELGRQLRAIPRYKFTPILFTTELSGEELSAYREIKCYDFLVKPFTQAQFSKSITNALELGAQLAQPVPVLRIQQKQFLFEYDLQDLLYVESFGKRLTIHSRLKGIMENANLPFKSVELWILSEGTDEYDRAKGRIHILNFGWDEIYEEGLADRVQEAIDATEAYYK